MAFGLLIGTMVLPKIPTQTFILFNMCASTDRVANFKCLKVKKWPADLKM